MPNKRSHLSQGKSYDEIGVGYDTSRRADPKIVEQFIKLLAIQPSGRYVDMGCGTGNYTSALAQRAGHWYGLDQSELMLAQARLKSTEVSWQQGTADASGYESNFFAGAICSLAVHHFPSLPLAMKELARILKPGGTLVIFTSTPEQMQGYWLNHYFPQMMQASMVQMPAVATLVAAAQAHKLKLVAQQPFFIRPELQDFFLYSGKQRPAIYLQDTVRAGISSFKNFCSPSELDQGLVKLSADIASGQIADLMAQYENALGDYLFIVLQKI